jgi:hypothetical protein
VIRNPEITKNVRTPRSPNTDTEIHDGALRVPVECAHSTIRIEIARSPSSPGIRPRVSLTGRALYDAERLRSTGRLRSTAAHGRSMRALAHQPSQPLCSDSASGWPMVSIRPCGPSRVIRAPDCGR